MGVVVAMVVGGGGYGGEGRGGKNITIILRKRTTKWIFRRFSTIAVT